MPKIGHALFLVLAIVLIAVGLSDRWTTEELPAAEELAVVDTGAHTAPDATAPQNEEPISLEYLDLVTEAKLSSFDDMKADRRIRALVVRSKTFYFFDGAQQRGLSYDALMAFEEFVNKKLKSKTLKTHIVFIPVTRDQLLPALLAGYGDIAVANLTITPEREEQVDFSVPILKDAREVLVTGPAAEPVSFVEDLSGREVHTRRSSSYFTSLSALNERLVEAGKPPVKISMVDEHLEDEDLLEMVNAGLIPAIVMDQHKAKFWQQIFKEIKVHGGVVLRRGADIAWALRKDSPGLQKMLDEFLRQNGEGTLLGNMLLKRYLKDTEFVENSLSTPEMQKFNSTAHLFQKYADRYDFDWLMVMSQAYQESRLDNNARSHTGAVGIMQMLPSTAADKNVNIPNISTLENNIHAGNKYLRFIRDRYFENEPMDELNKTLFSFAAYNAGPARVAKLRREAERQGLDPNVWFDNVEIIAAKRIGRETVQYVSNIYKYWVAYRLSRDSLRQTLNAAAAAAAA
jgi:membrane-bound lytic murein transglycosylase MltF